LGMLRGIVLTLIEKAFSWVPREVTEWVGRWSYVSYEGYY